MVTITFQSVRVVSSSSQHQCAVLLKPLISFTVAVSLAKLLQDSLFVHGDELQRLRPSFLPLSSQLFLPTFVVAFELAQFLFLPFCFHLLFRPPGLSL